MIKLTPLQKDLSSLGAACGFLTVVVVGLTLFFTLQETPESNSKEEATPAVQGTP